MHNHDPSAWPFWLSLGGDTIDACIGSAWLKITVMVLCGCVLAEYWFIAHHWSRLEKLTSNPEGKRALHDLRNIFILCGLCGYGMVIIRAIIPAWSLTIGLLICLISVTAHYILRLNSLGDIHRDAEMMHSFKRESRKNVEGETPMETLSRVKALLDASLERSQDAD